MINCVIDISHFNGPSLNFAKAKAAGILGTIHKATQGVSGADPMYAINRMKAQAEGLLFGAYHFAVGGDPKAQADHFLSVAKPDKNTLLVLDYEPNTQGRTMRLDEAVLFVTAIQEATGRWPGLYSGNLIKETFPRRIHPVLKNCWLWLAQYSAQPSNIPETWDDWTLWQYTDGAHGPGDHSVDGIGHCDRDQFNGDEAALRKFWVGEVGDTSSAPAPAIPIPALTATLRQGSTGDLVKLLQQKLSITADGNFGPGTRAAVITFQSAHGLTADGIIGPASWKSLFTSA